MSMTTLDRPAPQTAIVPAPLQAGDRVEIVGGGFEGYTGRILSVVHRYADIQPSISIYLDSGNTLMGFMPCQLRRA